MLNKNRKNIKYLMKDKNIGPFALITNSVSNIHNYLPSIVFNSSLEDHWTHWNVFSSIIPLQ